MSWGVKKVKEKKTKEEDKAVNTTHRRVNLETWDRKLVFYSKSREMYTFLKLYVVLPQKSPIS